MSRLIDADEVVKALDEALKEQTDFMDALRKQLLVGFAKQVLSDTPTVDAVEVMRCKDCMFYASGWCKKWLEWSSDNNGFCSWSERRKRWED